MRTLAVPASEELAGINTVLADDDAMFDGSDAHYLSVGLSAGRVVRRALRDSPLPKRILDLPCGHGRVTRVLRALYPDAAITGCDLDRSGVDYVVKHFATAGFYSKEDFRSLDLGERYDLIWVGSLLTHLSEQQTRRFLDFAERHMAQEGTLVITSHGAFVAQRLLTWNYGLTDDAVRGLLADSWLNGYGYRGYPGSEVYGLSLVRRTWYEDLFASGPLRLDNYEEQGWDDHQDVLVLRHRAWTHVRPPVRWPMRLLGIKRTDPRIPAYELGSRPPLPAGQQAEADRQNVSGFDEGWYLAADPLVAEAVSAGVYESGLAHYCKYGWREARAKCDESLCYDARLRQTVV